MDCISIVIPLYNKEKYICYALNSILQQTYKNYEVIIIDDGSIDGSVRMVNNWLNKINAKDKIKFRLISQLNQGVSVARNNGCLGAKFEYIALLDADDYWEPQHLKCLAELIQKFSDRVDLFSCAVKQIDQNIMKCPNLGDFENYIGIVDFFEVALISSSFIHSSSVCVKRKSLQANLFPVNMKNMEDMITWARIANNKGFAFNSCRTCVQVLDGAEASKYFDFINLERYAKLLKEINYDHVKLRCFLRKLGIIALSGSRLLMPTKLYFLEMLKLLQQRSSFFKYALLIFFVPKVVLKYVREQRKNS